nr:MAG TPA: hypothetical protein [Caudoviricetes sp.]
MRLDRKIPVSYSGLIRLVRLAGVEHNFADSEPSFF